MTRRKARPPSIIVHDRPMVVHSSHEKHSCAISPTTSFEDVDISLTHSGRREIQYIPIAKTGSAEVSDQNAEYLTKRPLNHESAIPEISLLRTPEGKKVNHSTNSAAASSSIPAKWISETQACPSEPKSKPRWLPTEDSNIVQLRRTGMTWEDMSKQLPGRSAISCRLRYQNYLERRSEWDDDRKNKLARLYERYVNKGSTRWDLVQQADSFL